MSKCAGKQEKGQGKSEPSEGAEEARLGLKSDNPETRLAFSAVAFGVDAKINKKDALSQYRDKSQKGKVHFHLRVRKKGFND